MFSEGCHPDHTNPAAPGTSYLRLPVFWPPLAEAPEQQHMHPCPREMRPTALGVLAAEGAGGFLSSPLLASRDRLSSSSWRLFVGHPWTVLISVYKHTFPFAQSPRASVQGLRGIITSSDPSLTSLNPSNDSEDLNGAFSILPSKL